VIIDTPNSNNDIIGLDMEEISDEITMKGQNDDGIF
jgi:hypothetical protein